MRWIDARPVMALVVNLQGPIDGSESLLIGKPMSRGISFPLGRIDGIPAIAERRLISHPFPTLTGLIDFRPESLADCGQVKSSSIPKTRVMQQAVSISMGELIAFFEGADIPFSHVLILTVKS